MISFAELLPKLEGATRLDAQNWRWTHLACGAEVKIHTVGSWWDAACAKCGKLGERDFRDANAPTESQGVERVVKRIGSLQGRNDNSADVAQRKEQPVYTGKVAGSSPAIRAGAVPEPERSGSNAVANGAASGVNPASPGGLVPSGAPQRVVPENPNRNGHSQPKTSPGKALVPSRGVFAADDSLKRKPPQDIEAEMSVLGAVLLDNEAIAKIGWLSAVAFYREAHSVIYRAFLSLRSTGDPIDVRTLAAALRATGHYEAVGGAGYIAELAVTVPTSANIEAYAAIVRDMALKRDIATRATQLTSLAYDGVSADALIGEMERLLKPISESNGPDLPSLITRDIEVWSAREFHARNSVAKARQWLVDGFLAKKEISLWSGKVEAGKTTLLRTLCMCVMRGEFFLERHTYPSRILYVMLDADGEDLTYEEFNKLGLNWQEDPIDFLVDPVMAIRPRSFEQFHGKLLELKPDMVIIDPLGRFEKTEMGGILDYSMTYVMARFSELAKQTNCHIVLLHHIPRGRNDADDPATAGFGSIAIAGGCNARFSCIKKAGGIYTIKSSEGKGGGFTPFPSEMVLDRDEMTHWVTMRGPYDWKEQARVIEPAVLEAVQSSEEWLAANDLGKIVGVQRSIAGAAAKSLARDGRIRMTVTKANKHLFARNQQQGELEDMK